MRTHTYEHKLTDPVPDSTPPEHRPNTEDTPFRLGPPWTSLDATLAGLERKREEQLASLGDARGDLVVIAHKESVARILDEIRTARQRLRDGTHGVCVTCHGAVGDELIDSLPWAIRCAGCVRRRYT